MTQTTESLQARIAELEAKKVAFSELTDLMQKSLEEDTTRIGDLLDQLAAAQLQIKTLRDALTEITQVAAPSPVLVYQSMEIIAKQALATPTSTEALDAYVAEKVKDSESRTGNQSPCYTIARDMAVRMWEKHYKTDAPNWEPLDDFMGVLSQISNMLTGLGNVEKITRQRDLAVDALKFFMAHGICEATYYNIRDALKTIKESESKL